MATRKKNITNPRNPASPLFMRLTRLFSGPIVNYRRQTERELRNKQLRKHSRSFQTMTGREFQRKQHNPFENLNSAYMVGHDREQRYMDFREMEFNPDISSCLDIYADEMTTYSDLEEMLKISCPNKEIKNVLHSLYHDILNINFNLFGWCRTMCKFGDMFLYLDIDENKGVQNAIGLPVSEVDRLEGEDPSNPNYVQFQWNAAKITFENWQVAHFRILGNDKFAPYGTAILDSARRIWRQLDLLENAMLTYRVVRASEKRVFYIDVGNISANDVEQYVQRMISQTKRNVIVDPNTGRADLRYNPTCHAPETNIPLLNGQHKTIKELSEDFYNNKDDIYVYSLDEENNIVPSKVIWAGKTRENTKFLEITLDDGQILKTTHDHKWILRDGTKIEAKDLNIGDRLMPFNCDVERKITQRYGSYDNFYINVYHPGKQKWTTGHKAVSIWKYGEYKWPYIIHHIDHVKFNNDPNNLQKLTRTEHALIHQENIKKLIDYSKSEEGRRKSREIFKKTREKYDFSQFAKELWKNKKVRKKRVDKLTLKTDSTLIRFVLQAIDKLGTTAKEYQIRNYINRNIEFQEYLRNLNPEFKNGFNDKLTKNQFRFSLRKNNFHNLREIKDMYSSLKAPWDKIIKKAKDSISRSQIFNYFGISKYDFMRLVKKHNLTLKEFDNLYLNSGFYGEKENICEYCEGKFFFRKRQERRFCNHECYSKWISGKTKQEIIFLNNLNKQEKEVYMNHEIVSIKESEQISDAYNITVENSTHIVAICGENPSLLRDKIIKSGIFVCNSAEEDLYIPVRGDTGTRVETLPAGQNVSAIDDVKYLRDKLFSALKVPQSYISRGDGADEDKQSLAQKDIRFARTIQRLQRAIISELEKIGIIHLYTLGFRDEDLLSFTLKLNNPSKIAELQELEHWRTRFEVANSATENMFSRRFIGERLFNLSHDEIERMQREMFYDKLLESQLEATSEGAESFGSGMNDLGGGEELGELDSEPPPDEEEKEDTLLVAPGKRDEPYLTPSAKGKLYYPEKFDKRNMGARKRNYHSKFSKEMGVSTPRNLFKGLSDIQSLSKGIYEDINPIYINEERRKEMVGIIYDKNFEETIVNHKQDVNKIMEELNNREKKVLLEKNEDKN